MLAANVSRRAKNLFLPAFFALTAGIFLLPAPALGASAATRFSDGFESNDFSAWTAFGGNWSVSPINALSGSRKASVEGDTGSEDDVLQKNVSTAGFGSITLTFWYRGTDLDAGGSNGGDFVSVEWYNGSVWSSLFVINNANQGAGGWTEVGVSLPEGAGNNSNFQLRFKAHLSASDDIVRIDDVVLTGADISPPVIGARASMAVVADAFGGATVNYTLPAATDNLDSAAAVVCSPAPGAVFSMGDTIVTCGAVDAAGNSAIPVIFTVSVNPGAIAKLAVLASPTSTVESSLVLLTIIGKDQYNNTVTNQSGQNAVIAVDNGGMLSSGVLTLTNGAATSTLTKLSAGEVNVSVFGGSLPPVAVKVVFLAADAAELAVTRVALTRSFAVPDDVWEHGWKWIIDVTAPASETRLAMQFSNFTNGSNVILSAGNARFSSAQSSGGSAVIGAVNDYQGALILNNDINSVLAGRQFQIVVEVKLPVGAPGGSYSASYSIRTLPPG